MDNQRISKLARKNSTDNIMNDVLSGIKPPLLNLLIVQKVLEFCKFNNENKKFFRSLRQVCKAWDTECTKILRRETEIPITRLLESYPNGLGWEEYRCDRITGFKYHYNCPLPVTRDFENFQLAVTCESFKDTNLCRWFSVMGEQVRSLHVICPLTCFHQNDYLAVVLQNWCPNLETLHLDGIQCFSSLIYIFEGRLDEFQRHKDCALNCGRLKNLIISVENTSEREDCKLKVYQMPPANSSVPIQNLMVLLEDFKEMIDLLPERNPSLRPKISEFFYQLIESKDPPSLSSILEKYVENYQVDWGLLGHVLRAAPLKKLVIKKLASAKQTQDLIIFLLTQPSKLRSTLKHLEFQTAVLSRFCLKALSLLKFSLSTFRVDKIVWRGNAATHLHDLLKNSSATLTDFEVDLEIMICQDGDSKLMNVLRIPPLPKLKSLTIKKVGLLHVYGLDLLRNAPYLETCSIDYIRSERGCQTTREALEKFCANLDDSSVMEHPLKKLKINVALENRQVKLLSKGLKNLTEMEFKIYDFRRFISTYKNIKDWKNLKALTISVELVHNRGDCNFNWNISNENIALCFDNMKSLKFLELTFPYGRMGPFPVSIFTNGFTKLRQLTSFKINNMLMLSNDKEEMDRSIAHVPFVSFSRPIIFSREEFYERLLKG